MKYYLAIVQKGNPVRRTNYYVVQGTDETDALWTAEMMIDEDDLCETKITVCRLNQVHTNEEARELEKMLLDPMQGAIPKEIF